MSKVAFTEKERAFLGKHEACRLATCHDGVPHVVPISYVLQAGAIYFATDYGTKKLNNIRRNPRVSLVVDDYASIGNSAVCVQGKAEIIERGTSFRRLYKMFHEKFLWVREEPWNEGEAPFVKITPLRKVSWGLGK